MIRLLAVLVVIIVVGYASGPTEETLTPCVSSRIATHSDDPTYAALAEQHNRSIDVNSELQTLNDLQQYPNIIELAQTRRAELDDAIVKVHGMFGNIPLVGDFDADGKADFAVWIPSTQSNYSILSSQPSDALQQPWGLTGNREIYTQPR